MCMPKLRDDAQTGGAVAGRTRKDIEQQLGSAVISKQNFITSKRKTKVFTDKRR